MMRRFLFLSVIIAWSGAVPAWADQDDPRLDTLFGNLQRTNSSDDAADYVYEIWQIWIDHEDPVLNGHMGNGVNAMSRNDLPSALGYFNYVVNADPTFAEAWNKRATVYYLMGHMPESLDDVKETLALEPRHFGALSGRGLLYSAAGMYPAALKAFEEAVAVNPFLPSIQQRIRVLKDLIGESET